MNFREQELMERLYRAADSFVDAYNEFWPDYPDAIPELIEEMGNALSDLAALDAGKDK
jgi:hypothetical protein